VHFAATDETPPLLTVHAPVSFQFGSQPGAIVNRSQASAAGALNIFSDPAGLQVKEGQTLALIGKGLFFEGGNLTANSGQIVLGSVAGNSIVSLAPDFILGYEDSSTLADISLMQASVLDASGDRGRIYMQGRNLTLADSAAITNFTARNSLAGSIEIVANELVEISRAGIFFSPSFIRGSDFDSVSNGAEVTIATERLMLKEGALILGGTLGLGNGGSLVIKASESVELSGATGLSDQNSFLPSLISTSTQGSGAGGDITINTQRLVITGGAQIQTVTYGPGRGGNLSVNATDRVYVSGSVANNASKEFTSGLRASSGIEGLPFQPTGAAGNLIIHTDTLIINDGARIAVNSLGSGDSGNLSVKARFVQLDNHAQLTASAVFGNGGNLRLENLDTLILRRGSTISTRAVAGDGQGNGGNIFIDADFIVTGLLEDSDIVAKATQGQGGNIEIHTRGLYGIARRRAIAGNGTNDIDASSEFGISGTTEINQLIAEAESGWLTLDDPAPEATASVSSQCDATGNRFVVTGRGGVPIRPSEGLENGSPLVDLGQVAERISPLSDSIASDGKLESLRFEQRSEQSVEEDVEGAMGWVEASSWGINEKNQVVLTAPPQPSEAVLSPVATCAG
jgi:large exoprotein involved in heme utilization and adhesion